MRQIVLRDLGDDVIERLERRAEEHGRTLEQEIREILRQAGRPSREELLEIMDRIRAMTPPGPHPLAEDLIREDRDSR